MLKFLKYWTGLQLVASMPFILPFAGLLHSLFGDRERSAPKRAEPKAPLKEFTTRTEPGPEIDWKRMYRRIRGHSITPSSAPGEERVASRGTAHRREQTATSASPRMSRAAERECEPGKPRRRGMQR